MLLAVDVGNTNTVYGVYKDDTLITYWRMTTSLNRTSDEIGTTLKSFFDNEKIKFSDIDDVIIASVVPQIMYSLEHAIRKYLDIEPMIIGPGIKTGIHIKIDNPKELGADRIVNAVGAIEKYGGPLIVVDFGTATTFCAINSKSEYIGGIISPGLKISSEALYEKAAKLPKVELVRPNKVIGKNTIESMQSGIVYGYSGQVKYIVNKMKKEMKEDNIKVIATGGLARMIAQGINVIDEVDSFLTLFGLNCIYKKNKK